MPKRLLKRRFWPVWVIVAVVVLAFLSIAASLRDRSHSLNSILRNQQQLIYQNCVSNENQDAVIVSILRSIPPSRRSPVIVDAINTLEPPGEKDCQPPEGTQP